MEDFSLAFRTFTTNSRKIVFGDLERHFSLSTAKLADDTFGKLCHLPFLDGISTECIVNDFDQFELQIGLSSDDEFESFAPLWTLATGVRVGITIYAPTVATSPSAFYQGLMEHMFNMPSTTEMVEWWSEIERPLPSRLTIDFTDNDDALCAVISDLYDATIHVV